MPPLSWRSAIGRLTAVIVGTGGGSSVPGQHGAYWEEMKSPHAATRRHLPTSPFKPRVVPPVEQFSLHDKVSHDRYGLGVVTGVEQNVAVIVDFGSHTERIPVPYTKLVKL